MLPNVNVKLGQGGLGRVASSSDGVVGLIVTGQPVEGDSKLKLNKPYVVSSTRDLALLGIEKETNTLLAKELTAFYAAAGDGAELHFIVVSEATTMKQMCLAEATSPLSKLIESAAGRIKVVGVNKIAPVAYEYDTTEGIDKDAIEAMQAAHDCAESFTDRVMPFRVILAAPKWSGTTEGLFKPAEASCNRVAMVLASDDEGVSAAVGKVLGRVASIGPHQSIGYVALGQVASEGHFTDGSTMQEKAGLGDLLHDAGYIFYRSFPTRNGCYFNAAPMCAPQTDDYSTLELCRVIDKATVLAYSTYLSEIQGNLEVEDDGTLDVGLCKSYESMLENAVTSQMKGQISSCEVFVDPVQNVLSTNALDVAFGITPLGIASRINIKLSYRNPAIG